MITSRVLSTADCLASITLISLSLTSCVGIGTRLDRPTNSVFPRLTNIVGAEVCRPVPLFGHKADRAQPKNARALIAHHQVGPGAATR